MLKKIIKVIVFSLSFTLRHIECSIQDTAVLQHIDDFITKSINNLGEEALNPQTLQIICNIFFSAFEYARFDLEYNQVKRVLMSELHNLNKEPYCTAQGLEELFKKVAFCADNKKIALQRWTHVTDFMNTNEVITKIFTTMATERLEFLNSLMNDNYEELENFISTLLNNSRSITQKLHTYTNFFDAALKKELPFDYNEPYTHLKEIDILTTIVLSMHKELDSMRTTLNVYENYNEDFLTVCAILDMFYFNRLHEMLLKRSQDSCYHTILFNEHGLVPVEERVALLPYVIN